MMNTYVGCVLFGIVPAPSLALLDGQCRSAVPETGSEREKEIQIETERDAKCEQPRVLTDLDKLEYPGCDVGHLRVPGLLCTEFCLTAVAKAAVGRAVHFNAFFSVMPKKIDGKTGVCIYFLSFIQTILKGSAHKISTFWCSCTQ